MPELVGLDEVRARGDELRARGQRIVSTNGCFDVLHPGHVQFLEEARALGDVLIVGLNSDASTRLLKGEGRPVHGQADRANVLLSLRSVDYVCIFDGELPNEFLAALRPHVHCKAGDYREQDLPERRVVIEGGGEIRILAHRPEHSSSVALQAEAGRPPRSTALVQLLEGSNTLRRTAYALAPQIERLARRIADALPSSKVLLCGNGGSAADAQHVAAELVVRFSRERAAIPAIALTTDTSVLTAAANDYSYERVFERQVEALGAPGDFLIALSTSGKSPNILRAAEMARRKGMVVVALTGERASPLGALADVLLDARSGETQHIQEAHIAVLHTLCDLLEEAWQQRAAR